MASHNRFGSRVISVATALAVTALLNACGGGGGTTSVFTPPLPATGSLAGNVANAKTGGVVEGASVQTGSLTATSAADGKFAFAVVEPASRAVLRVNKTGFAEQVIVTQVTANVTTSVSAQLLPVAVVSNPPIDLATGGAVTVPATSGQVVVPANGQTCTGNVVVSITPINASLNPGFLPGDFSVSGSTRPLESFGAVVLTVNDANGVPVSLANCAVIALRIPVSSRAPTLQALLPLYYLDSTTGRWIQEGNATLGGTAPAQYYQASVSHAGTWSVHLPYDTVNVTGCVADVLGARVAGSSVQADGIDYTGSTTVSTDAAGNFALPIKKSATAALTARSGGKTSNSIKAGPSAADIPTPGCLVLTDQANNVTVKLTWGEAPADVDGHLLTPSGDHIFFDNKGNLAASPWANLDVDDTTSFGPEIVTLRRLQVGVYTYSINNYTASQAGAGVVTPGLTASPTRVELNIGGSSTSFAPPAGEGSATWWSVFTFSVDAQCRVTVTPVNTWSATAPVLPAPGAAVNYCTAP